jgi:hypothetical protein
MQTVTVGTCIGFWAYSGLLNQSRITFPAALPGSSRTKVHSPVDRLDAADCWRPFLNKPTSALPADIDQSKRSSKLHAWSGSKVFYLLAQPQGSRPTHSLSSYQHP